MNDVDTIRRIAIKAMFSDDELMDRLTLKGGNALRLVYEIGTRASIDIDLSLEDDFQDIEAVKDRVFELLRDRFDSEGYVAFDLRFDRRPPGSLPGDSWGGYDVEFKAISKELFGELGGELERIRRRAQPVGDARQTRRFKIQMSAHEYCQGRRQADFDDYTIYVYTPEMIVAEKLRAICQQMPEYSHRANPTARSRDFYDIHQLVTVAKVDLGTPENIELCRNIFAAKKVPLASLAAISKHREFHRVDWSEVKISVQGELAGFDFYFDAALEEVSKLEALWVE